LPYKGVQVLLTTWTICQGCFVPVAHLDQRLHDEVCPARCPCRCQAEPEPPVLERAS
jgi:hypothetical protein